MRQEGISSTTPSLAEIQRVQALFEEAADQEKVNLHGCEFGAVAGALKRFFRELPAPIYTNELYPNFVAIQSLGSMEELLQEIANLFVNLPTANQMILHLVLRWLYKLVQYSAFNKLTSAHLGTLWQPNLIFDSSPGAVMSDSLHMTADGQMLGLIVTMMIDYYPHFFAEFDAHFAAAEAERAARLQAEAEAAAAQEQQQQMMMMQQQQEMQYQQQQQQAQYQQAQQPQQSGGGYQNYFESVIPQQPQPAQPPAQQPQQPQQSYQQPQSQDPYGAEQQGYQQQQQYQPQQQQYQQQGYPQQQYQQQPMQPQPAQPQAPSRMNATQQAQRLQLGAIASEALLKRGGAVQDAGNTSTAGPVSPRNAPVIPQLPSGAIPQVSGAVSPRLPSNIPVVAQPPTAGPPKLNVVIPQTNVQVAAPGAPKQPANLSVPMTPSAVSPRQPVQTPIQTPQTPASSSPQRKVPVVVNGYTKGLVLADWFEPLEGRLPLTKDDVIFITKKHQDGWWEGYKQGRRGFFPSTFVSEICQ